MTLLLPSLSVSSERRSVRGPATREGRNRQSGVAGLRRSVARDGSPVRFPCWFRSRSR